MKGRVSMTVLLGMTSVAALAANALPPFPGNAHDESEPQMVAWYQARCESWATDQRLEGDNRDSYVAGCVADAPNVWPVGLDKSDD